MPRPKMPITPALKRSILTEKRVPRFKTWKTASTQSTRKRSPFALGKRTRRKENRDDLAYIAHNNPTPRTFLGAFCLYAESLRGKLQFHK